jgi:hypothetical protein
MAWFRNRFGLIDAVTSISINFPGDEKPSTLVMTIGQDNSGKVAAIALRASKASIVF